MVEIKAQPVKTDDLQPGDLFSPLGEKHWNDAMVNGSLGQAVYIRTNAQLPTAESGKVIYKLTVIQNKKVQSNENDNYLKNMIEDCVSAKGRAPFTEWEEKFIDSIEKQYENSKSLSGKQISILEKITEKI